MTLRFCCQSESFVNKQNVPTSISLKLLFIGIFTLSSCATVTISQTLPESFTLDENIYIEKTDLKDSSEDRFTRDNLIYVVNREFFFNYKIIKNGKIYKIAAPPDITPIEDFQRSWNFIDVESTNQDKIEKISIKVLKGFTNENQTLLQYNYYCNNGDQFCSFSSTSGVIENKMNTWAHPHRDKYFMILELNPFPFIQAPYQIGNKWKWNLRIGSNWSDERWKKWSGSIENKYEYEIIGQETINIKNENVSCWVISASANSSIGQTSLVSHFNETKGFVRLDYTNIDGSHVIMELVEVKN